MTAASALRQLLALRRPRGLVGIRTVRPRTDADRVHRRLAASAFPDRSRAAASAIQVLAWCRWVGFDAWWATVASWKRVPSQLRTPSLRGDVKLFARSLWWALVYGIPPGNGWRLGIYTLPDIDAALAYVYEIEAGPMHLMRSKRLGDPSAGRAILADKSHTAALLHRDGIPSVAVVERWAPGDTTWVRWLERLETEARDTELVVKPNSASGARGVVRVGGPNPDQLRDIRGRSISIQARDHIDDLQRRGDVVIAQPYVATHPLLHDLGSSEHETVVITAITTIGPDGATLDFAYAEIPDLDNRYAIAPIDDSGTMAEPLWSTSIDTRGRPIPGWSQLVANVTRAHNLAPFKTNRSVSWDVVIGAGGPLILEGNTSWGVLELQRSRGPLLTDPHLVDELLLGATP